MPLEVFIDKEIKLEPSIFVKHPLEHFLESTILGLRTQSGLIDELQNAHCM